MCAPLQLANKNSLFFGMLLGLIEQSLQAPGEQSIEGLRKVLMDHLREHPKDVFNEMTLREHAETRFRSKPATTRSSERAAAAHPIRAGARIVTPPRPGKRRTGRGADPSHAVQEDASSKRQRCYSTDSSHNDEDCIEESLTETHDESSVVARGGGR